MAYISTQEVKEIRNELKAAFPQLKLSVTRENYTSLYVAIMEAPVRFTDEDYRQLNPYYLDSYQNNEILKKITAICNKTNYNNSDTMTDYFEVGYYFHLHIGKWNKSFKLTN